MGHSERIANAYYLSVTDADFEKATSERGKESAAESGAVGREALQNPVQSVRDREGQEGTQPLTGQAFCPLPSLPVYSCTEVQTTRLGFEPRIAGPKSAVLPLHHRVERGSL